MLTDEEKKQKRAEYNRRYKEKLALLKANSPICANTVEAQIDYKAEFIKASKQIQADAVKIAQYEKLISSFAEKENQSKIALQRATLEYNARLKYMLESVKHAYQSIQFAANAINPEEKGANNGN
mgnify:CR=1 FL=1